LFSVVQGETRVTTKKDPTLRGIVLGVRLNQIEKTAIEKWAKSQDLPPSIAVRRLILTTLRSDGFLK
jgi:hypothetical protein